MALVAGADNKGLHLSSAQRAARTIARDVIVHDSSRRLPTAQEYQEQLAIGSGTVQKGFEILEASGALSVRARGHHGRFIVDRDFGQLWAIADYPPARAILTPPGALEIYGLVAGFKLEFERIGIPLEIDYIRGADNRLAAAAQSETAFAILSSQAAAHAIAADSSYVTVKELGPQTYYADGSIVVIERAGDNGAAALRVGVDHSSYDNIVVTEAEVGPLDGLDTVECTFLEIPAAVSSGRIDVGVWHRMLLLIPLELAGLTARPLSLRAAATARELSSAAMVVHVANASVKAILEEIAVDAVVRQQKATVEEIAASDERIWYR